MMLVRNSKVVAMEDASSVQITEIATMCCMHIGIAVFLGLTLFGIAMCVLNLALFAVSPAAVAAKQTVVSYEFNKTSQAR